MFFVVLKGRKVTVFYKGGSMKKIVAMAFALALSGCASYRAQDIQALINSGKCSEAREMVNNVGGSNQFNNLGVIALDCERDRRSAQGYFEYAARQGNQLAVQNLIRNGWPVPNADLKAQNDARSAAEMSNAIQLLQAGQAKPATQLINQTNCTSRAVGNTVQTNCW